MLESIIYTLTSIDGIDKVIIKVEGKTLEKLPNSKKIITIYPYDKVIINNKNAKVKQKQM